MSRDPRGWPLRAGYLPARLVAFFEANPDEELTCPDLLTKFGATPSGAKQAIHALRLRNVIETVYVIRKRRTTPPKP